MKKDVSGFGVGYRPPHYQSILESLPRNLDWLEVISENFMSQAPGPRSILEKIRQDYPIALHGVSLSIGSVTSFDRDYLNSLRDLALRIEPGFISDHLCWTQLNGYNAHDLLPMPFTEESLQNVIERVNYVQDFLKTSILLENPSAYVGFADNHMSEGQYFNELCQKTGCGILLDLNNVFVNFKNLGADPYRYLSELPKNSVKQFHMAGHSTQDGALIDTHDHPVTEEVWKLYEYATTVWPKVPTLVEWDDKIPPLETLLSEVEQARKRHHGLKTKARGHQDNVRFKPQVPTSFSQTLNTFFTSVTSLEESSDAQVQILNPLLPVPARRGLAIYKDAYFLRLEGVLKELFPTLFWILEDEGFRELALQYLSVYPPTHFSVTFVGDRLAEFLKKDKFHFDFGASQAVLCDIAVLEWARVAVFDLGPKEQKFLTSNLASISEDQWETISFKPIKHKNILSLDWDVGPTWSSADHEEAPPKPKKEKCCYIVWQHEGDVSHRKFEKEELEFFMSLETQSFKEACKDSPEEGLKLLLKLISEGLISAHSQV